MSNNIAISKIQPSKQYKLTHHFAEGGNGYLYCNPENENEVIKWFKRNPTENKIETEKCKRFKKEITFLQENQDLNFVPEILDYGDENHPWFMMKRYSPLKNFYKNGTSSYKLTIDDKINICLKLVEYIKALHQRGYAHRDIKPSNILIKSDSEASIKNNEILLTDYGLISDTTNTDISKVNEVLGSDTFTALEAKHCDDNHKANYYFAADIYSFVKTLWAIIKDKEYSFEYGTTIDDKVNEITIADLDGKNVCLEPIYELIELGTNEIDKNKRPTLEQCTNNLSIFSNCLKTPNYPLEIRFIIKQIYRNYHIHNSGNFIDDNNIISRLIYDLSKTSKNKFHFKPKVFLKFKNVMKKKINDVDHYIYSFESNNICDQKIYYFEIDSVLNKNDDLKIYLKPVINTLLSKSILDDKKSVILSTMDILEYKIN